jgi:uncharacterized protein (DUF1015 family)
MAEIHAFQAIRYDLGHVGSLGDVVAPPYDVIGPEEQNALYEKHPCNVVRLILNRKEPGDDEANNAYTRANQFLKNWLTEGVLFTESDPAIYVYNQQFTFEGVDYNRRGFICRLRLSRFGEGQVFPHEETHSAAKADRLMLSTTCKANLSQVFGLYPDAKCEAQGILEKAIIDKTPLEVVDDLGVTHRMWPVNSPMVIAKVVEAMGNKPIFIADGHHRYETACNYRDQVAEMGLLTPEHPANFVSMQCVAMDDPGLAVLPTHRLFEGLPDMTADELSEKLAPYFNTRIAGEGPELADQIWEEIQTGDSQGTIGLCNRSDKKWVIAELTEAGMEKMAEVAAEHSPEWQALGVSLLHRLILETILSATDLPKPTYVHLIEEVISGLQSDKYPMAAVIMPATVDDVRAISLAAERMPAKSTYFYPKLLSGLIINPLE